MKIIKELSEMITEEIGDAKKYAKEALLYKTERQELSRTFYNLANDELGHANTLHGAVVGLITKYRDEHGEPPEAMMAVCNYLHEKQIEAVAEVNSMLALYKG